MKCLCPNNGVRIAKTYESNEAAAAAGDTNNIVLGRICKEEREKKQSEAIIGQYPVRSGGTDEEMQNIR
jgi:hypothetical protein